MSWKLAVSTGAHFNAGDLAFYSKDDNGVESRIFMSAIAIPLSELPSVINDTQLTKILNAIKRTALELLSVREEAVMSKDMFQLKNEQTDMPFIAETLQYDGLTTLTIFGPEHIERSIMPDLTGAGKRIIKFATTEKIDFKAETIALDEDSIFHHRISFRFSSPKVYRIGDTFILPGDELRYRQSRVTKDFYLRDVIKDFLSVQGPCPDTEEDIFLEGFMEYLIELDYIAPMETMSIDFINWKTS